MYKNTSPVSESESTIDIEVHQIHDICLQQDRGSSQTHGLHSQGKTRPTVQELFQPFNLKAYI